MYPIIVSPQAKKELKILQKSTEKQLSKQSMSFEKTHMSENP